MLILTHDCPRCPATSAAFVFRGGYASRARDRLVHTMFACPRCDAPVLVQLTNASGVDLNNLRGDVADNKPLQIALIEPAREPIAAPESTPAEAAEAYTEALDSLQRGKWTSAASMLRRCLEVALKQFSPDIEAWKLERRIDQLAAAHRITPALQQWAHDLRLDGNEALHGTEPATEELATRMERLTYFLLTYLFTLPAEVEAAKAVRDAAQP